jgi:P4 family phage/plasmid primase-like protien
MANPTPFHTTCISLFHEPAHDPDRKDRDVTLSAFIAHVRNGSWKKQLAVVRAAYTDDAPERYKQLKEALPGVTPAGRFARADNAGFQEASGIVQVDIDKVPDAPALRDRLAKDPHVAYAFVSPSTRGVKAGVRCIPLVVDPQSYKAKCWTPVAAYIQQTYDVIVDDDGVSCKQLLFVSHDPDAYLNPQPIPFELKHLGPQAWLATMGDHPAGIGCHDAMIRAAAAGIAIGMDPDELKAKIEARMHTALWANSTRRRDVLGRIPAKVDAAIDSAYLRYAQRDAQTRHNGHTPPSSTLPYSDYTNALAFVEAHKQDFRYCYPWKTWMTWRKTHWERDETGQAMRCAKQTITRMLRRAEDLDSLDLKALMAHVKSSLSTARLKALLESAQSEDGMPTMPDEWDTHPWLLNCANGTIDLRTGVLMGHQRADYLIKRLTVPYDPKALCPTWDAFLWRIMGGTVGLDSPDDAAGTLENRQKADEQAHELITFLQRAVGYALTGEIREECLFLLYGTGQNGKSKFLGAMHDLLGDYAQATHSKTFMVTDRMDGIPNDLARLRGARFISAIELGKNRRLNEELVKRVTGADLITARFMHGEFFDFMPQFKLFMATNYLPKITSIDKAMWRRIHQIPFTVTIPDEEKDDRLGEKLRAELPGILAWAVRGCLAWQQQGLMPPVAVQEATAAYKSSMDTIGRFIEECCHVDCGNSAVRVRASILYDAYKQWCETNGEHFETMTAFGTYLENQGFEKHASNGVWRLGIGLRT